MKVTYNEYVLIAGQIVFSDKPKVNQITSNGNCYWIPKYAVRPYNKHYLVVAKWWCADKDVHIITEGFNPENHECNILDGQFVIEDSNNYKHQKIAIQKMLNLKRGALFMEMGTGKTKVAIEVANRRFSDKSIEALLYLCPLSVKNHIEGQFLLHGLICPYLIIGIESLSSGIRAFSDCKIFLNVYNKLMLVIDEAHLLKNYDVKRSQKIQYISSKVDYCIAMTGTPITQSPSDLFGIFAALSPNNPLMGYSSWRTFEKAHLVLGGYNKKQVIGYRNLEPLIAHISPTIYQVQKVDCLELPLKQYQIRNTYLAQEVVCSYNEIKETALKAYKESSNENIILKMFTDLQKLITYGNKAKLEEVQKVYLEKPQQIIIWCKYLQEIDDLALELQAVAKVYSYTGKLNSAEKHLVLNEWRSDKLGILVATMSTGGVGIDLTESSLVVYYSNSFKYSERIQSEDRCHRIGQIKNVSYIDILTNTGIDKIIANCISRKADLAETIRNMVKEEVDFYECI